ncbi:MAG: DinB family protein [Candidatus Sulfotelmatobacter sp.]
MDFLVEAISHLSATPQQAEDLMRGLSDEQLSWKPGPDVFSVRENVWHLRDIDVEGYAHRIRLISTKNIQHSRMSPEASWRGSATTMRSLCSQHSTICGVHVRQVREGFRIVRFRISTERQRCKESG